MSKKKKQDNVQNLDALRAEYEKAKKDDDVDELKYQLHNALEVLDEKEKQIQVKDEEIKHLKSMLEKSVPVIQGQGGKKLSVNLSPEEQIAEMQLDKLKQASQKRALTLEETKIYDMLVKNKRLSQNQSTSNVNSQGYRDVEQLPPDIELMKIASKKEKDSGGND